MVYLPSAVAALAATATRVVRGIPRVRCPRTRLRAHPLRRLCAPVPVDLPLRVPVLLPSCHARRLAIWTQWLDTTLLAPVPHRHVVLTIPKRLRADCLYRRRRLKPWIILDNKSCQGYHPLMLDIQVIDDPAAATVALEPIRSRLLSELAAPASAATLATRVGLARQKVNYHLHALEAHGLVRLAQERKWGGLTERLLVATAASYVVSPS